MSSSCKHSVIIAFDYTYPFAIAVTGKYNKGAYKKKSNPF